MLMIVVLHCGSHGGIHALFSLNSANGILLRSINILCMVSVNVFVLISGYYLSTQEFRPSRLLKLIIEALFYSWLILILIVLKDGVPSPTDIIRLLLPITYNEWWFLTAYTGMVLLSPLINRLLATLNKKQHLSLVIVCLLLSSFVRDILIGSDPFSYKQGHSVLWFSTVYIVASYLRKHLDLEKIKKPGFIYLCSSGLMLLVWCVLKLLESKAGFIQSYELTDYWLRYNSVLNIIASVMFFISFLKMKPIESRLLTRIIAFLSPLTFGVYLIHDSPYMRDLVWLEIMKTDRISDDYLTLPHFLSSVLCVFIICLAIDVCRSRVFHFIENQKWFINLMSTVDKLPCRFFGAKN